MIRCRPQAWLSATARALSLVESAGVRLPCSFALLWIDSLRRFRAFFHADREVAMGDATCGCDHSDDELIQQAYDLIVEGDFDEAERRCRHVLEHGTSKASALNLAGCIAAERGAFEDALCRWKEALEVDPGYSVPATNMAEVYINDMQDPEQALEVCEAALLTVADDVEGRFDLLVSKAQALSLLLRDDEALDAMRETKGLEVSNPDSLTRLGETAMAMEEFDVADGAFRAALRIDADHADANYGLGWLAYENDEHSEVPKYWLRTLEQDLAEPRPPWHLTTQEFEAIAEDVLMELPERARALLRKAPIVVEDAPSVADVKDCQDPRMLGVFCGVPLDEQSHMDPAPSEPNVIKLYQRNLEASCRSREELVEEIRMTVLHETAHFFGLEESEIEQIGLA